ncbi:MAG: helix-turn-helix domain-containing protein [Cyanobacteria bacterium]|nr:helix-turn-helix domain-containing protein [Cyanobacteriota bacterium]
MAKQDIALSAHGSEVTRRLGQVIRRMRLSLGLSPADFSEDIGSSTSFIIRLEEGTVDADLRTLERCANALGIELSSLMSLAMDDKDT